VAVIALTAAGCGSDDTTSATVVQAPTTSVKPATTTGGAPAGGEQAEGGAGDEEAVRVPVTLTADGGALSPTLVTIPAFLAVELRVSAKSGAEKLTISAPGGGTLSVSAGQTATKRLAGLKPGDYPVRTAGGGKATLHVVSGGEPGP
jgi:hypothetical protein